jgi:hypothetical protein
VAGQLARLYIPTMAFHHPMAVDLLAGSRDPARAEAARLARMLAARGQEAVDTVTPDANHTWRGARRAPVRARLRQPAPGRPARRATAAGERRSRPGGLSMSDRRPWRRLLLLVVVTSLVLSSTALTVVVPAALAARTVARGFGGDTHPLGRLLARPPTRSVVHAADGSVLAVLHGDQDRTVVPLSAVPATVRDTVLAIEDARFYAHGALDLRGIARAAVTDLFSGHISQGGSDLTQQYVKNVVTGDRVSLHRKLVEALDAAQLERRLSKDQILAAYLNRVYFGEGVYGIATAAEHYFSRPLGRLTLAQAAALAGTIASPERFRPTAGGTALARRDEVLDRMAAVGFASPARVAAAKRQPLRPRLHPETVRYPYFVDDVTRTLLGDHALDGALGPAGSAARRRAVFEGGLSVTTTLRPDDQRAAERAVGDRLDGAGRPHGPRPGHRRVRQRLLRPADGAGRDAQRDRRGQAHGDHLAAARLLLAGARHRERDPAGAGQRLRHPGRRRRSLPAVGAGPGHRPDRPAARAVAPLGDLGPRSGDGRAHPVHHRLGCPGLFLRPA